MEATPDLFLSRHMGAKPAAIWKAWSDPQTLARWWAPEPVKTEVLHLDLQTGGGFQIIMTLPDGSSENMQGCFLEVIENRKIVFTDCLGPGFRPKANGFMTAVIEISENDEGCLYSAKVLHASDSDRLKHEQMGFYQGWRTVMDQLAKLTE